MSITPDEIRGKKENGKSTLKGLNKIFAHFYPAYSVMVFLLMLIH